jgi:histidyl-tRNA synthetase
MPKPIIEPKILKGTRDFLPQMMMKRNHIMGILTDVFQRFGYNPIETPILTYAEILLGKYGEEGDRLTYNWEDKGGRQVALPYDLTVPTARYVAANWQNLPMPFKRYQIQRVWRAEKPQKGRLREFYQCDMDIIGTRSLMADVEIAKVLVEGLKAVGFDNVVLKVNSRRLINAILDSLNLTEYAVAVIRSIDKMDKIGEEGVQKELTAIGVTGEQIKKLFEIFSTRDFSAYDTSEIDEFMTLAKSIGISESDLSFDPLLARGMDYYTGMIFEAVAPELGVGSLAGGGRYDNLCATFSKQDFSGVGASFGFERIMLALEDLGKLKEVGSTSQVLITLFDDSGKESAFNLFNQLLQKGIRSEVYFQASKLGKQFKYADKKSIPYVIVQGPDEREKGEVNVKDMKTGKETAVSVDSLVDHLNNILLIS